MFHTRPKHPKYGLPTAWSIALNSYCQIFEFTGLQIAMAFMVYRTKKKSQSTFDSNDHEIDYQHTTIPPIIITDYSDKNKNNVKRLGVLDFVEVPSRISTGSSKPKQISQKIIKDQSNF